jgi:hypothetical protein
VSDLSEHFQESHAVVLDIIASPGAKARRIFIRILYVGKIDVNDSIEEPEGFHVLVAAGVIDKGKAQSSRYGEEQGLHHGRHLVGGGNEIDIMGSLLLEAKHSFGKLLNTHGAPHPKLTDGEVLTKHAL